MGHKDRIWYVKCRTTNTFEFVALNKLIGEGIDVEHATKDIVVVKRGVHGKRLKKVYGAIEIEHDKLLQMIACEDDNSLVFDIYMQESRGAKITPCTRAIARASVPAEQ